MLLIVEHGVAQQSERAEVDAFFSSTIAPLLREHCYECHSHAARKIEAGLTLDSRAGWEVGGDSGRAIVPGDPAASLLIQAVRYQGLEMPPTGKLPDRLVEQLEQWVADGAHDPRTRGITPNGSANISNDANTNSNVEQQRANEHWAFQPLQSPAPPADVRQQNWPRNRIDQFILAKLEAAEIGPTEDADRFTWLRRVTFDLTGLPPTVAEIDAFTSDTSPLARERVVDRLLASPAFGERWARHWLDLVGYADQVGTSNNVFAEHAWRYRDYVIGSHNNDTPFDQFVREQIAGDLLPYETVEQHATSLTATGFLVLGDVEIVESDKAKLLVDIVDQQLRKVSVAFLGMTLGCARCHDHKFDPITQRDYYAMAGFFHSTSSIYKTDRGVWSDIHAVDLPETPQQKADRQQKDARHAVQLDEQEKERHDLQRQIELIDTSLRRDDLADDERTGLSDQRNKLAGRMRQLDRQLSHGRFFATSMPRVHAVRDRETPVGMHITIRGNPRALGELVPRGFVAVLDTEGDPKRSTDRLSFLSERHEIPSDESGRRQLAEWIVSRPLTARVVVNRIWQKLFVEGLVRSVDYFGLPGETPSHPELLDFLARQLIESGWSRKQLIRSLVLSRTYGLASRNDKRAHATDPDNRLLWRMNRVRLDAEAIRDAMVAVSGDLVPSNGGPALPLEFPENVGGLDPTDVNPPSFRLAKWRPGQQWERTVYLPVIRHAAQPGPAELRNVFDFAQPSQFVGRRNVTAVPTQALFLLNSETVKELATRLATAAKSIYDDSARLDHLWLLLFNRPISAAERSDAVEFMMDAGEDGWTELCHALLASSEFLMRL